MDEMVDRRLSATGAGHAGDVEQRLEAQDPVAVRVQQQAEPDRERRPLERSFEHHGDAVDIVRMVGTARVPAGMRLAA